MTLETHVKLLSDALDDERQENQDLSEENDILKAQVCSPWIPFSVSITFMLFYQVSVPTDRVRLLPVGREINSCRRETS